MLNIFKKDTELIKKLIDFEIKDINDDDRTLTAIGSTEQVDRDGDIIVQAGWKLKNFKRNPVILWGHDYRSLPVGRAEEVGVEDNRLKFKIKFATKNENPMAEFVYNSYKNKFLRTFSVGFIPLKSEDMENDDDKKGLMRRGRKFISQELLELSCVSVPSNVGATTSSKEIQEMMAKIYQLSVPKKQDKYNCECIKCGHTMVSEEHCKNLKCPKCGGQMRRAERPGPGQDGKSKGVIPFKSYPKAPEGEAWDAGKEVREAEISDLKIMATWFDSENPEAKTSYKLPHHKASNKNTVWRAVAAAMGALLGARGGVRVPTGDRRGIYNHLAKHYKEFDKEAPEFRAYEEDELNEMVGEECYDELLDIATEEQNNKEFDEEQKRGRVLSEKNRSLIKDCNESISKVAKMLTELLGITEKPDDDDNTDDDEKLYRDHMQKMAVLKNALDEMAKKIQGVK